MGLVAVPDEKGRPLLVAATICLLLGIGFGTFTLGATEPWAEAGLAGLAGIALVLSLLGRWRAGGLRGTDALALVALFLAFVLLQLAPLPYPILRVVSPQSAIHWRDAGASWGTISLTPMATWRHLRALVIVVCVFATTMQIAGDARLVRRLLSGILAIGVAAACVAIGERVVRYPGVPTLAGWAPIEPGNGGPFVNHSHFGQLANLAVGAGIALALLVAGRRRGEGPASVWLGGARLRPLLGIAVALGVVVLAIPLAFTIGGSLGTFGCLGVALLLFTRIDRRARGVRLSRRTRIALVAVGLVVVVGMVIGGIEHQGGIVRRLQRVEHDVRNDVGYHLLANIARNTPRFPAFGVGLGSYGPAHEALGTGFIHPHIRHDHYENGYAQLLFEIGIGGCLIVAAFLLVAGQKALAATVDRDHLAARTVPGVAGGLTAVLLHTLTDFGQYLPAIASATAVLFGVLLGWRDQSPSTRLGRWLLGGFMVCLAVAAAWATADARRDAAAETLLASAVAGELDAKEAVASAVELRPNDPDLRYEAVSLRWEALRRQSFALAPWERFELEPEAQAVLSELQRVRALAPLDRRIPQAVDVVAAFVKTTRP